MLEKVKDFFESSGKKLEETDRSQSLGNERESMIMCVMVVVVRSREELDEDCTESEKQKATRDVTQDISPIFTD